MANTHLTFVPGSNRIQLRRLVRDLRGFPGPRVLLGDLKTEPKAPVRRTGLRPLATAPTFPVDTRDRQLDHILTDDARPHPDACCASCRSRIIGRSPSTCPGAECRCKGPLRP
jgi:endonuclease/exonuclease/phosphatase family metal-dependent hydrolase